jgi:hypothetical protein
MQTFLLEDFMRKDKLSRRKTEDNIEVYLMSI